MRNPFNLARLAELLDAGVPADQLRPLQTQLDLLEVYWHRRVRTPAADAGGRERLLRASCERAVALLRLSVPRADVLVDEASDRAANQLLRGGVLIETDATVGDGDTLAFSHHVLFDYAVARLLLRIDNDALRERLGAQPELALLARPSLTLHAQWRWQHDRVEFWTLVFSLLGDERIPLLARLVGPAVASDAHSAADLQPVLDAFDAGSETTHEAHREVLRHLIGAVLASGEPNRPFSTARTEVWAPFLLALVARLRADTAVAARILTWGLHLERERLRSSEREAVAQAARDLLDYAVTVEPHDNSLIGVAVEVACATFDTAPEETEARLRPLVERDRLARLGFAELLTLAESIPPLAGSAPGLVGQLFANAFDVDVDDEAPVALGGPVLGMTSNRRQDYGGGLYHLAGEFAGFQRRHPRRLWTR